MIIRLFLFIFGIFFLSINACKSTKIPTAETPATSQNNIPNSPSTEPKTKAPKESGTTADSGNKSESKCEKSILFLGNSFTFYFDVPGLFKSLAEAGGHKICIDSITQGGSKLVDFSDRYNSLSKQLDNKLQTKWDIVILQEQSFIPAILKYREQLMYPSIRDLNAKILKNGAKSMLYMTWGYKNGINDVDGVFNTFEEMQEAITEGYQKIAHELSIPIAPVGTSFLNAKKKNALELWDKDGKHQSLAGSYLAACVFYAVIFDQSPVNLGFFATLPQETAVFLQETAIDTVKH